eukprot:GGOE01001041.1.p1 GENE.GGOE01001041.1~~GGOE01001041.1.p1  ORF type:complete len:562 (-),score=124.32 GGOE01001041.1:310-1773(-)
MSTSSFPSLPHGGQCFPPGFEWAVATAAYQVEGAVTADNRGRSIWDVICDRHHPWYGRLDLGVPTEPGKPKLQAECGNTGINMRHTYDADFAIMGNLGAQAYRLSLSWCRVMAWDARRRRMVANPKGVRYYHQLFRSLSRHGIRPYVTLYHWDLPYDLYMHTMRKYRGGLSGGWTNPEIADHFVDFATVAFREFGSYASRWFTFNEARSFVNLGYEIGGHPPFEQGLGYVANKVVLLAHAKAVGVFRRMRAAADWASTITLVVCCGAAMPKDPLNEEDVAAADWQNQFEVGIYTAPVFYGNYPDVVLQAKGFREFGPDAAFSIEEQLLVRELPWARDEASGYALAGLPEDVQLSGVNAEGRRLCPWFFGSAKGYRHMIRWVHRHTPNGTALLLTENGFCGSLAYDNSDGLRYYQRHLRAVWESIVLDRVPVLGYAAWSYADNYEWGTYEPRFGLMFVDRNSSQLERIAKPEAYFFRRVATTNCLPHQ